MMFIAIGVYAAGSIASALAPTMLALILGRALQGLGGGGLMPLAQTIIGDVASPRDRPRYQALTSTTFIISTVGGPPARRLHCRAPALVLGYSGSTCRSARLLSCLLTMSCAGCRATTARTSSTCRAVLMVGAAIALMLALTWGGRRYAWTSPEIIGLCIASAAVWVLFAMRVMTAAEPFIPLSILRDGAIRVGTLSAFFAIGTVLALTIILPLYSQLALGLSVSESAWSIVAASGAATA